MEQSCTYNDQTYSHGSVVCQSDYEYRCNDGTWDALNTKCNGSDGEIIKSVSQAGEYTETSSDQR